MGNVISSAANGIGGLVGNAFSDPFKKVLGDRCKGVCSGAWDLKCFVDHLCVAELARLLMTCGLCFIILVFIYLWFELGICQCIAQSLCKMCCACCEAYSFALGEILCFTVQKMKKTRRERRRRFQDIEKGFTSSSQSESSDDHNRRMSRRRRQFQDIEQEFTSSSQSGSQSESSDDTNRRMSRRRRQFQEIEQEFTSSSQSESLVDDHSPTIKKKRQSTRKDENIRQHSSLNHSNRPSNHNHHHESHLGRLKMRNVSVRLKGGSKRVVNSRRKQRRVKVSKKRSVIPLSDNGM